MTNHSSKAFYKISDAAKVWDLKEIVVRRLIENKQISAVKIRKLWRIPATEISEYKTVKGALMKNKKVTDIDFTTMLSNFETVSRARKTLDELTARKAAVESRLDEIRQERRLRSNAQIRAERLLKGGEAKQSNGEDLNTEGQRLQQELQDYDAAIAMARTQLETANRKASASICQEIADEWAEQLMRPIFESLLSLRDVLTVEKNVRQKMEEAGIQSSSLPGFALLADPREPGNLFELKLDELCTDYPQLEKYVSLKRFA